MCGLTGSPAGSAPRGMSDVDSTSSVDVIDVQADRVTVIPDCGAAVPHAVVAMGQPPKESSDVVACAMCVISGATAAGSGRKTSPASLGGSECWGHKLSGTRCDATKWGVSIRGTSHFYMRFCAACQTEGVRIPVDRLRILDREVAQGVRARHASHSPAPAPFCGPWMHVRDPSRCHPVLQISASPTRGLGAGVANSTSNGIWTGHQTLPPFRALNQTARCKGPIAVVFATKLDEGGEAGAQPVPSPPPAVVRTPTAELGWSLSAVTSELFLAADNASAETAGLARYSDGPADGSGSRRSKKRAIEKASVKEDASAAAPSTANDPIAWRLRWLARPQGAPFMRCPVRE